MTDATGEVEIEVPGTVQLRTAAGEKRQRRLSGVDEIVLSLYAKGLTTGDIAAHFADIYDASVSKETVSPDHRPGDRGDAGLGQPAPGRVYAAVFIDAIVVKVRDGQVANRPIYAAIGVSLAGQKTLGHVGRDRRGRREVLDGGPTELRNRGVTDVFFLVCDGLKGLPDYR